LFLSATLKGSDSKPPSGGSPTSQDLRRGSGAAEEDGASAVRPEKDLVRRSSGESAEEESMPARRSRRQEAQKPVTGVEG